MKAAEDRQRSGWKHSIQKK